MLPAKNNGCRHWVPAITPEAALPVESSLSTPGLAHKICWALFRLFIYLCGTLNLLTLGLFAYLIAPYTSYFYFGDPRFWKYLRLFPAIFSRTVSYLRFLGHQDRMIFWGVLPLTAPPMNAPDPARFKLSAGWTLARDTCGGCSACCRLVKLCPFFDESRQACLSYGSPFFRYFSCGRFPVSVQQMRHFQCPKFEAVE